MLSKKYFLLFILFLRVLLLTAQPIDNTSIYRTISDKNYFRFYYDNDFFTATDYYYSQGVNLEFVHARLNKFPLTKLLIHPAKNENNYGVAIEHLAYTPSSIRHTEIILGDRPFAACLSLKTFSISVDTINHWRLSSTLNTGIIGTSAGGEWMQKTIHRNLNNIEPLGWSHQIHNDIVLNYDVAYEQLCLSYKNLFLLNSLCKISAGTLHDKASIGINLMFGHFNNPFKKINTSSSNKNFQLKFYNQPSINFIGYDATLQGGMFNNTSPYKLSSKEITRFTFEDETGITLQLKNIYLEYFQHYITKEFETGLYHRWGGIRMGIAF
ncbi:MAG: lipid A deacylase LpxR family protein [Bacteroidia bacterium]